MRMNQIYIDPHSWTAASWSRDGLKISESPLPGDDVQVNRVKLRRVYQLPSGQEKDCKYITHYSWVGRSMKKETCPFKSSHLAHRDSTGSFLLQAELNPKFWSPNWIQNFGGRYLHIQHWLNELTQKTRIFREHLMRSTVVLELGSLACKHDNCLICFSNMMHINAFLVEWTRPTCYW